MLRRNRVTVLSLTSFKLNQRITEKQLEKSEKTCVFLFFVTTVKFMTLSTVPPVPTSSIVLWRLYAAKVFVKQERQQITFTQGAHKQAAYATHQWISN